jgi:hypothetical protein
VGCQDRASRWYQSTRKIKDSPKRAAWRETLTSTFRKHIACRYTEEHDYMKD